VLSGLICWTAAGRREAKLKEHAMRTSQKITGIVTTIGIDIGKKRTCRCSRRTSAVEG
jgi:hypothetical protein